VRVLAAGVSFTDALLRAGTYFGAPQPPFTPGYEIVGEVETLGPGCQTLSTGTRVAALTVWGGYAERVCLPEAELVEVTADVDPALVVSLVLPYVTAYQLLHRVVTVRAGDTVLVHGAAGRVGTAVLELGALAGTHLIGTASARHRELLESRGAVALDYRENDLCRRVREHASDGVDVVLDGIGGALSLRSFGVLKRGGTLVIFGHYGALSGGQRSLRGWLEWYLATAAVAFRAAVSRSRKVRAYRIQKLRGRSRAGTATGGRPRRLDWFREDLSTLLELTQRGQIHPVVAKRLPLADARRAHELLNDAALVGRLVLVP